MAHHPPKRRTVTSANGVVNIHDRPSVDFQGRGATHIPTGLFCSPNGPFCPNAEKGDAP